MAQLDLLALPAPDSYCTAVRFVHYWALHLQNFAVELIVWAGAGTAVVTIATSIPFP